MRPERALWRFVPSDVAVGKQRKICVVHRSKRAAHHSSVHDSPPDPAMFSYTRSRTPTGLGAPQFDCGGGHGVANGLPFSTTYMASTFVPRSPAFTSCTTPGRTCQD